jgi:hypothetical protein
MDGQSGNASYNSLQVAIKKRLSYGVNLNVAYPTRRVSTTIPTAAATRILIQIRIPFCRGTSRRGARSIGGHRVPTAAIGWCCPTYGCCPN